MSNCMMFDVIGKGRCQNAPYSIWSIWKRESVLECWYVVLFNSAYRKLTTLNSQDEAMRRLDEWVHLAVDIRTLPNYKPFADGEILFNREGTVVPLIKEAVRKGYIVPLS